MWLRHSIKYIPGVAATQRWLLRQVLSNKRFVHTINAGPANGLRFEVTLPEDKAIWAGIFEPSFSQVLYEATGAGDICYDIGGYRGYMSGVMALAGASKVIVFEPLPANIRRLERLTELNRDLPIRIERTAIGAKDGQATFKLMSDQSMGKLTTSSFQTLRPASGEIMVPIIRLDTYVFQSKAAPPKLIKVDVEGAEVEVLEGAAKTLQTFRPEVFVEAHSETLGEKCLTLLNQLGYTVRQLETGRLPPDEARHLIGPPK